MNVRPSLARPISSLDVDKLEDVSRHSFDLEVASLADGSMLRIPVDVIAGRGLRPRVVLVAGIHGDESEGMLALMELSERIEPHEITGRLIIVPVANPLAFAAGVRRTPLDGLDLNRVFPGSSTGSITERIAHVLFTNTTVGADLLFSLHSWYAAGIVVPYIEVFETPSPVVAASFRAAVASGFDTIRISDWPPGLLTRCANDVGVLGIESEVGGMGTSSPEGQRIYRSSIDAVLRHVGMLSGGRDAEARSVMTVKRIPVSSPVGGLLRCNVKLGDVVAKGDTLGTIHDLHGNTLATIVTPRAGTIAAHRTLASVAPGDHAFWLFEAVAFPNLEAAV